MKDIRLIIKELIEKATDLPVLFFVDKAKSDFILLELIGGKAEAIKIDRAIFNVNYYSDNLESFFKVEERLRNGLLTTSQIVNGDIVITSIRELHRPIMEFDNAQKKRFSEWGVEVTYNKD